MYEKQYRETRRHKPLCGEDGSYAHHGGTPKQDSEVSFEFDKKKNWKKY